VATTGTKSITIALAGAKRELHDVDIAKGASVRDTLEKLNLTGKLTKLDDPTSLNETDNLYARVVNGEKLVLSPDWRCTEPRHIRRVRCQGVWVSGV